MLAALYQERKRLAKRKSKQPGIGTPKLTVGLISGGINTNVVPDRIVMRLDRRLIPEENGAKVEKALIALIKRAAKRQGHLGRLPAHHPGRAAEADAPASSGWSSRCSATPGAS